MPYPPYDLTEDQAEALFRFAAVRLASWATSEALAQHESTLPPEAVAAWRSSDLVHVARRAAMAIHAADTAAARAVQPPGPSAGPSGGHSRR